MGNVDSNQNKPCGHQRVKNNKKKDLTESDYAFLTAQTGQSREKIKEIFDEFMKGNPDAKLNKAEFQRLYHRLKPETPHRMDKISNMIFRAFDSDKNGYITFNEFMIAYALTNNTDMRQRLEYAFGLYDTDKSNSLDKNEIRNVINGFYSLYGAVDRSVGNNEAAVSKMVEDTIKDFDLSKDGAISRDEFISGVMKNPRLATLMAFDK